MKKKSWQSNNLETDVKGKHEEGELQEVARMQKYNTSQPSGQLESHIAYQGGDSK